MYPWTYNSINHKLTYSNRKKISDWEWRESREEFEERVVSHGHEESSRDHVLYLACDESFMVITYVKLVKLYNFHMWIHLYIN